MKELEPGIFNMGELLITLFSGGLGVETAGAFVVIFMESRCSLMAVLGAQHFVFGLVHANISVISAFPGGNQKKKHRIKNQLVY